MYTSRYNASVHTTNRALYYISFFDYANLLTNNRPSFKKTVILILGDFIYIDCLFS